MQHQTAEEKRWLQALESAAFGVWDLDPRLERVHFAPPWKARLGFPRIHAPDDTEFWRCRVHPDDFGPMLAALRAHLDGHAPSYAMQFRLRINGSGYRTVLSRGRVVARDPQGTATRMVGTMVDLTGRPAAAPHGLALEDPDQPIDVPRPPLHAVLGIAGPHTAVASEPTGASSPEPTHDPHHLIEAIDDLLDLALRDSRGGR